MAGFTQLFIPGPTNIPEAVRQAMNVPMEDMRAPNFPEFTTALFQDLKKVFKNETGHVFVYPSSGTGAWEAAMTNVLSPGDRVVMSRFGQFSHLWVDMAERPEVREALHLASPGLMRRLAAGSPDDRVAASVTAYLVRMCTRATPFGLFAGCATGVVGGRPPH